MITSTRMIHRLIHRPRKDEKQTQCRQQRISGRAIKYIQNENKFAISNAFEV